MAGRRPRRHRNGITFLQCSCPIHEGEWLNEERFGWYVFKNGRRYRKAQCKEGYAMLQARRRYPHLSEHGRIPVTSVRKWLWEIIRICGGVNAAARTIGVKYPTMLRWLGHYRGYHQVWIIRSSARRILETLVGLRAGTIEPQLASKQGGKQWKYRCRGCGGDLALYTPGCTNCMWRKSSRKRHGKEEDELHR